MLVRHFQIRNYKTFVDSRPIKFEPGINVIVGRNNSGKSSLIEALFLEFQNTIPIYLKKNKNSHAWITFKLEGKEIASIDFSYLKNIWEDKINLAEDPFKTANSEKREKQKILDDILELANDFFLKEHDLCVHLQIPGDSFVVARNDESFLSHLVRKSQESDQKSVETEFESELLLMLGEYEKLTNSKEFAKSCASNLFHNIRRSIFDRYLRAKYIFKAERLIQDANKIGDDLSTTLHPDASNLASYLNYLQGENPQEFQDINECLRLVFPEIQWITVSQNKDTFEVLVWYQSPEADLYKFKLSQCGSGVGQVIAILAVVISMKDPSYILIDEPQSFLHPGAARNLVEILQLFSEHQYFITTHSPNIIRASDPACITLLRCENLSSTADSIDKNGLSGLRTVLSEVGLKFSDFFGADQILWVEGPTEEKCFPLIIRKLGDKYRKIGKPPGIEILSVTSVGDFETKRAELIFDVYDKLGTGSSLFPPATGFIFDRELREDSDMQDMERRRPGQVKFIPRRMYENYLLSPRAIAHVLNKHDIHEDKEHSPDEIKDWIVQNHSKYSSYSYESEEWFKTVDAAKLLKDCFNTLTESRVAFSKTTHSVQLTEWLLDNQPEELRPLADFLSQTMKELEP